MGYTAKQLVAIAEAEIGYHEKATNANLDSKTANSGKGNYTKYGRDLHNAGFFNGNKNGADWCAQFPTWCVWKLTGKNKKKTEYILCVGGDLSAGCGFALKYYKAAGRFDKTPKVGDQIFFKYNLNDTSYTADHTGIVVRVTDKLIETIEGNSGNEVKRKAYDRSYYAIIGYGHPRYDAETATKAIVKEVKTVKIEMPVLRKGSSGNAVKTLQRLLRQLEYVNADGKALITVDGSFGSNTEAAVKRSQKNRGVKNPDGIVGAWTWNKLLNGR
nr:MAG TPA: PlyB like endolysin [Bacteriophage sp.]